MAHDANPKKQAQDIAEGYFLVTPPMLKKYTPTDFKTLVANLAIVARDLRQEQVPLEDVMAIKARNMKLSRLNQAEMVIRAYCKKLRIVL